MCRPSGPGIGRMTSPVSRTLPGGVFFELLERRSYGGYGAVNAPIRLAAQARLRSRAEMSNEM